MATKATIRDHIIPLAEGGPDTDENTQPLCQACSDRKTASESQRGILRQRGGVGPSLDLGHRKPSGKLTSRAADFKRPEVSQIEDVTGKAF